MEITAYHEAGHAMMAVVLGATIRSVTIDPDWDDGPERFGDTQVEWPIGEFGKREVSEKMVLVALAGPAAEMIFLGEPDHSKWVAEWSADWSQAWDATAALFTDERSRLLHLKQALVHLQRLLNREDYWAMLAAIVDHLLAHETLEDEDVRDIMTNFL
jgi:ATP-dependent Zn protease